LRLAPADGRAISLLREEKRRESTLGIVPVFYDKLAGEAQAYAFEPVAHGGESLLGYALALERPHNGHSHVTTIEFYLRPDQRHRYEDALDLLKEQLQPTAYLTRTDDCLYNATLLSRGHQVEPTALVMLWRPNAAGHPAGVAEAGIAEISVVTSGHLDGLRALLDTKKDAEMLADVEALALSGRGWTVLDNGRPVGAIVRRDAGDGVHELLDFALARAGESHLAGAMERAALAVAREGLRPAAVIDVAEAARHRVFRGAGFFTAASYLVYYDPEAGRPSVAAITTDDLRGLLDRGERVRLVDVLGEEHWKQGHIPGSEWMDFKGLAKQAKRRFEQDEPIVLYCDGFT
jgi:hypothetical protein